MIAATSGLELVAVATSDPERKARLRRDYPAAAQFDHPDELLDAGGLDLVVVATPNRFHVPLALAAIARHVAVVVDKPMAPSSAEGRRLLAEASRAGVPVTVFQNRRWDGDFLTVRRLIAEGALGHVSRYESRFERWRPTVGSGWRDSGDPGEAGGVLMDLGAHLVDQALELFGPVLQVYAEIHTRRPNAHADDDAFVALSHASGTRSHLFMSAVAPLLGPRLRVLGDRAGYTKFGLDPQEAALAAGHRPGDQGWGEDETARWGVLGTEDDLRPIRTEAGRYQAFYAGVAAALRDGTPMPVDPADSLTALTVIEAARESSSRLAVVAPKAP